MSREFELLHHMEDMSLDRRTRLVKRPKTLFRVHFVHCGTDWTMDHVVKPSSLTRRCQKCGAVGVGRLEEVKEENNA